MIRLFLGKGVGQACYIHPKDETKVIKITYSDEGRTNSQNSIDF